VQANCSFSLPFSRYTAVAWNYSTVVCATTLFHATNDSATLPWRMLFFSQWTRPSFLDIYQVDAEISLTNLTAITWKQEPVIQNGHIQQRTEQILCPPECTLIHSTTTWHTTALAHMPHVCFVAFNSGGLDGFAMFILWSFHLLVVGARKYNSLLPFYTNSVK
jgi:hypothetical protein